MPPNDFESRFKAGKTSLAIRYVDDIFSEGLDHCPDDGWRKQVQISGEAVLISIVDTAGECEYTAMRDQYVRLFPRGGARTA